MAVRKGVVGVIFRQRKDAEFLLLHRQRNWKGWELSKGGIEGSEKEEEALRREITEETGLKEFRIRTKVPGRIEYKYGKAMKNAGAYQGTVQSIFLVESLSSDVKISDEHDNYQWADYRTALRLLKHENQKKALSKSMQFLL